MNNILQELNLLENTFTMEVLEQIDSLCDRFERDWKTNQSPLLEDYLAQAQDLDWSFVFRELLLVELQSRRRLGENPTPEEYILRFPKAEELIRAVFAELACDSEPTHVGPTRHFSRAGDSTAEDEIPLPRIASTLRRFQPFANLPQTVLDRLLDRFQPVNTTSGERLIRQGEPGSRLLFLLEGEAAVLVQAPDGASQVVSRVGPGAVLGEMSLLTNEPCTANVVATSDGRALALAAEDFYELTRGCQVLSALMSHLMAERLEGETDVLAGKMIAGYCIERCGGHGGVGRGYEAWAEADGRHVALKMLSHHFAFDWEMMKRFQTECEICKRLAHPHIITIYERFSAFNTQFLAMEFCDGGTLADRLRTGPPRETVVRRLAGQLASALACAHENGIVHRDVKPANILFDENHQLRLTDFGLARSHSVSGITSAGHIIGTPRYMAPEQLVGEPADARSDIFAFGCVVFEMLAGRPLFQEKEIMRLLRQHAVNKLPPREEIRPGMSEELYRVLEQSLSSDPEQRTLKLAEIAAWA